MLRHRLIVVLATAVLVGACASSGQPGSSPRRDRNRIVAAEWQDLNLTNALEAVRRLRPAWLTPRGTTGLPVVFRNNARWSNDPSGLENIQIQSVIEISYLNGIDASTRFGTGYQGGAIIVTTR